MKLDIVWMGAAGLLATALLAGALWLVARRRSGRIEMPEDAASAAEATLGGFRTAGAVVGGDGAAALVVDAADRVALCRKRGKQLLATEVGWTAIRATGDGLLVDTGSGGAVLVAGVDALDVRRMRAQEARSATSPSPM